MKAFLQSFVYAFRGVRHAFLHEKNFVFEIIVGALVFLSFINLPFEKSELKDTEKIILLLLIGWVLFAELMNTAIERMVDLVHPENHPLAGIVKDLAAAAVLVSSLATVAIGLLVYLPHYF